MPEIVPEEAEIVRSIYRMCIEGKSTNAIDKRLTQQGIPTPAGKKVWQRATVESILRNEKYKGAAVTVVEDNNPTDYVSPVQSSSSANLQALVEKFNGYEVPVLWKEDDLDKSTIKRWLGIEVSKAFFDLGGLKRVMPAFNISEPSYKGTDDEIKNTKCCVIWNISLRSFK